MASYSQSLAGGLAAPVLEQYYEERKNFKPGDCVKQLSKKEYDNLSLEIRLFLA